METYIDNIVIENIKKEYTLDNLTEQINIKASRQAYKQLGKEPSRYRVSSEALIRRILQNKGLYKINNVVDTNNLISIETGYSVGSYDLEKIQGYQIDKSYTLCEWCEEWAEDAESEYESNRYFRR